MHELRWNCVEMNGNERWNESDNDGALVELVSTVDERGCLGADTLYYIAIPILLVPDAG